MPYYDHFKEENINQAIKIQFIKHIEIEIAKKISHATELAEDLQALQMEQENLELKAPGIRRLIRKLNDKCEETEKAIKNNKDKLDYLTKLRARCDDSFQHSTLTENDLHLTIFYNYLNDSAAAIKLAGGDIINLCNDILELKEKYTYLTHYTIKLRRDELEILASKDTGNLDLLSKILSPTDFKSYLKFRTNNQPDKLTTPKKKSTAHNVETPENDRVKYTLSHADYKIYLLILANAVLFTKSIISTSWQALSSENDKLDLPFDLLLKVAVVAIDTYLLYGLYRKINCSNPTNTGRQPSLFKNDGTPENTEDQADDSRCNYGN